MSKSYIDPMKYASLSKGERLAFLATILAKRWSGQRRDSQIPGLDSPDEWVVHLFMGGRGAGKDLDIDTDVFTVNRGWRTMGTLQVGDIVLDSRGKPCNVTWCSRPVDTKPCYRITLSDRSSFVASDTHEWIVIGRKESAAYRRENGVPDNGVEYPTINRTTEQMFKEMQESKGQSFSIPVAGPYNGDIRGDFSRVYRYGCDVALYGIEKYSAQPYTWLWSKNTRLSFLAGVCDAAGSITKNQRRIRVYVANSDTCEFIRTHLALAGIKSNHYPTNRGEYCIDFPALRDFGIPFHRWKLRKRVVPSGVYATGSMMRLFRRKIRSIERVPARFVRCIQVDSPDSSYCVGRDMVPTHNTRTGAEWLLSEAIRMPGIRCGIIAPTYDHAEKVCLFGESGICSLIVDSSLYHYNASKHILTLANGSIITLYSSEHQRQLRGPQFHRVWVDEPADLSHGKRLWDVLKPAVRLQPPDGSPSRILVTGTPRANEIILDIMDLVHEEPKIYTQSRSSSHENRDNLTDSFIKEIDRYKGSRFYEQEALGELIVEAEGALWSSLTLKGCSVAWSKALEFDEVIVAIDPAVSTDKKADETGIIVLGVYLGVIYVIADYSMRASALEWARKAIEVADRHDATTIVFEGNLAGPLMEDILRKTLNEVGSHLKLHKVMAKRSKLGRAEPVSALYEAGIVKHLTDTPLQYGSLDRLETQMTSWEPTAQKSPDRLDALVHGVTYLNNRANGGSRMVRLGGRR